jgi:hypothetical protein
MLTYATYADVCDIFLKACGTYVQAYALNSKLGTRSVVN